MNPKRILRPTVTTVLLLLLALGVALPSAYAASQNTWTGLGDNLNWTNSPNWSLAKAPTNSTTLYDVSFDSGHAAPATI